MRFVTSFLLLFFLANSGVAAPEDSGDSLAVKWQGEWRYSDGPDSGGSILIHECYRNECKITLSAGSIRGVCELDGKLSLLDTTKALAVNNPASASGAHCAMSLRLENNKLEIGDDVNEACSDYCGPASNWGAGYQKKSNQKFYPTGFNCGQSKTAIDRFICTQKDIADFDRRLSLLYAKLKRSDEARQDSVALENLIKTQKEWLATRNKNCQTSTDMQNCLEPLYCARLQELQSLYTQSP